jgi:hypothetical protein
VALLEWWSIPRRAWMIILVELCGLVVLSGSLVSQYVNDIYFQNYVNSITPLLVPVVSVSFGVVSASTATFLYLRMKALQSPTEEVAEDEEYKQRGQKRAARKTSTGEPGMGRALATTGQVAKLKPIGPSGPGLGRAEPAQSAAEDEA